ncbi:hypothetical protein JD844_011561 [Phrynosoma platyrhinos]|uniref:Uncharacterized protein n=1 Tax=Phrynosoma platyrhinos TaxID=52577 RepID=A0ABQ7TJ29_PHRPL|nr:hypothetical protein JD844_011561 [Phrynosoma platyrhinos]
MTTTTTYEGMDPSGRNSSSTSDPFSSREVPKEGLKTGLKKGPHPLLTYSLGYYRKARAERHTGSKGKRCRGVLRPPGGGSSFNMGFDLPKEQQGGRRNKMASTPKSSDANESSEPLGSQRRNSSDANSGDCVDAKNCNIETLVMKNMDMESYGFGGDEVLME